MGLGRTSGSPFLDAQQIEIVGLHRKGGRIRPLRNIEEPDTYCANEAVWIESVRKAVSP